MTERRRLNMIRSALVAAHAAMIAACASLPTRSGLASSAEFSAFDSELQIARSEPDGTVATYAIEKVSFLGGNELRRRYYTVSFQEQGAELQRDRKFEALAAHESASAAVEVQAARRLAVDPQTAEAVSNWAREAASAISVAGEFANVPLGDAVRLRILLTDEHGAVDHRIRKLDKEPFSFVFRVFDLIDKNSSEPLTKSFRVMAHESYHIAFAQDQTSKERDVKQMTLRRLEAERAINSDQVAELASLNEDLPKILALEEAAAEIFAQCAMLEFSGVGRRTDGPIFSMSGDQPTAEFIKARRKAVRAFFDGSDPENEAYMRSNIVGYFVGQMIWEYRIGRKKEFTRGEAGAERVDSFCRSGALSRPENLLPLVTALLQGAD